MHLCLDSYWQVGPIATHRVARSSSFTGSVRLPWHAASQDYETTSPVMIRDPLHSIQGAYESEVGIRPPTHGLVVCQSTRFCIGDNIRVGC